MSAFSQMFAPLLQYIGDNPSLRMMQGGLILSAALLLFLLFFALRDILLRTHSFWYQFVCIVIVTLLPVVGFLIYLLIRPARTIKQREVEAMLHMLTAQSSDTLPVPDVHTEPEPEPEPEPQPELSTSTPAL